MKLIADSGSTKTTWMEVESGNKIFTEGLNPHFTSDEQFLAACSLVRQHFQLSCLLSQDLSTAESNLIQRKTFNFQLFFYGAGCGNASQRERVERLLSAGFCAPEVHVETDMLGACRAVSGNRPSLVAILGTGSNACFYNGTSIECQPTSTGFILGDQGSANHVGRILLNDYLTHRMPDSVRSMFYDVYGMSDDQLIDAVYHRPTPNRFLASLAPFAVQRQETDYCRSVIEEALYDWRQGMLTTLQEQSGINEGQLHLVGGFAKAIEPTLRNFMSSDPLAVGTILADPIDGLRQYHNEY